MGQPLAQGSDITSLQMHTTEDTASELRHSKHFIFSTMLTISCILSFTTPHLAPK